MIKNWNGFLKLLDRYQKRRTDAKETQVMDAWYDSIRHEQTDDDLSEEKAGREMWNAVRGEMTKTEDEPVRYWWRGSGFRLAAASLLLALGVIGYRYAFVSEPVISGVNNDVIEKMIRITNSGEGVRPVTLSEGSVVKLEPGATLYYPATFTANERSVFLKGNGFFEITPDKTRPFFVHANHIITRVVGTSFTIKESKDNKSIEVAVLTGIVEVKQASESNDAVSKTNQVVLTQNKKVTFYQENAQLVTGLVEQPKMIKAAVKEREMSFNYVERPLSTILPVLEEVYGVKIDVTNENIKNCIITADMSQDKTLFAQLEILCEAIEARFEVKDDHVLLAAPGCEPTNKTTLNNQPRQPMP